MRNSSTSREKLAASLDVLEQLQSDGRRVFKSKELGRIHRERLVRNGFLREVIKGWLISSSPDAHDGDSTPWFASFWMFCATYCQDKFGNNWHLSPEQSLVLHGENTVIPQQLIVQATTGSHNNTTLLFGTSLYDLRIPQMPPTEDVTTLDGMPLLTPAAALVRVSEAFFASYPVEAAIAIGKLTNPSDLIGRLLGGGHTVIAGRLAGAFRRLGQENVANEILAAMKSGGFEARETDPFTPLHSFNSTCLEDPPLVTRIRFLWNEMRQSVIDTFPQAPGLPADPSRYLKNVDDIYQSDAYHSLSIEGYRVTPALIDQVRSGQWNPKDSDAHRQHHNALAARGYWQCFQSVRGAVEKVIKGQNAGELARDSHNDWYRALFQPSVAAGVMPAQTLAGYRKDAVYLKMSRHLPPRAETVRFGMAALFDLLEAEPEPSVRAVLGHWMLGYIHPYVDGNGRIARFLMNLMLASGGYPWTVILVEQRKAYLEALECASVDMDIQPFADFIAHQARLAMTKT